MSAPGDDGLKPTLQRVGGGKKVIEVGASSLVDLKVELARKRQEYVAQCHCPMGLPRGCRLWDCRC